MRCGIAEAQAEQDAIKKMLLYNPWCIGALLIVFRPPFETVGQALYDLVARNRRRLKAGAVCKRLARLVLGWQNKVGDSRWKSHSR